MKRTLSRLALAGLATLVVAAPALATHNGETAPPGCRYIRGMETPQDHSDDVYVCKQDVWIHKGATRLGNLTGQGQDTLPSWNTTQPTGTLQDSAGVFVTNAPYDVFVGQDPNGRAMFQGSFTGTLDTLAFKLFLKAPVQEATNTTWPAVFNLKVDGEILYDNYDTAAVAMTLKPAGNVTRIDAAFLNLYEAMKGMGLDLSPTKVHTVELGTVAWYFGDSHAIFFYDSAETASGLTFNLEPTNMSGYTKLDLTPAE